MAGDLRNGLSEQMQLQSSGWRNVCTEPQLGTLPCTPKTRKLALQQTRCRLAVILSSASADDGRVPAERDVRYRRADFSDLHAFEARQAFVKNIASGEAGINLADAALAIAAEDDALVSHSSVKLPVQAYAKRMQRMAEDIAHNRLNHLPSTGSDQNPMAVLEVVQHYLYKEQGFQLPLTNLSGVPEHTRVDHPGVWENAKHAYLHEALISKRGIAAVLAVLQADVLQRLMKLGAVEFAVRTDCSDFTKIPTFDLLPGMTRSMLTRPDGSLVNTCTSDAIVQILRFLKRAYWPFAWDSSQGLAGDSRGLGIGGGFASAAQVALEGEADAAMQAIARTAKHRLERGIWTSPGAGDLRRAKAACERLVLVAGHAFPAERRDLGVILLHCGFVSQAYTELQAYMASETGQNSPLMEKELVRRLLSLMQAQAEGELQAALYTVERALTEEAPSVDSNRMIPLTW